MSRIQKKLNILIHDLGSLNYGIIRKFKESNLLGNIYIISKNQIEDIDCIYIGTPSNITFKELKTIIKEKNIDFAIIFNELYSSLGLTDYYFNTLKLPLIGVKKFWFDLETSKFDSKSFMNANNIKTPDFFVIKNLPQLEQAVLKLGFPLVIKNNCLQAGFGSYICKDKKTAIRITKKLLKHYDFCIAEKFIIGDEISQQYFWDKNTLLPLLPVKDFKKDNKGLNTGGMGSYTPVKLNEKEENLLTEYNNKLEKIFKTLKPDFTGIFTVNLLFSEKEVYTLEFNMRPGITEFETTIEHIQSDILELFYNCATGHLKDTQITYKNGITGCIALAHKDYSKQKLQKCVISLKRKLSPIDNDIRINWNIASFDIKKNILISSSHRFLSVLCTDSINPFRKIYKFLDTFEAKDIYYRKDIGV